MKNREFSIEDGYQILICFLPEFWWNFLKEVMLERGMITDGMTPEELEVASAEEKIKDDLYRGNAFVFDTVTSNLGGCGDYLEEIIEQRMNISPKKQHEGLIVKEDVLFQLIIDWCHYFNEKFKESSDSDFSKDLIDFSIEWLEDMRKHPKEHKKEWDMWNKVVDEVEHDIQKGSYSTFNTHLEPGNWSINFF